MVQRLFQFIKRPTSKNVIINTVGSYLNIFFTALFALILVRILTPAQYGVLSVLLGIAYVLANILDFGITATIYSYFPSLYEKRTEELYSFIKSTFFYQSFLSLLVIAGLFISFPSLDKVFFKTGAPLWELWLTSFSVLFLIWQNFFQNILFAAKKFLKTNIYLNLSNILKTSVILFLSSAKLVTVGSIIFVFGIIGPAIFFLFIFIEKREVVNKIIRSALDRKEVRFGYTFTYFIASQFFNLGLRMDLFLFLALFFTPDQVYELFFTRSFNQTSAITKALSRPFILYALGSLPMLFLLYTVKKPIYILISNIVFFLILTLGSWWP